MFPNGHEFYQDIYPCVYFVTITTNLLYLRGTNFRGSKFDDFAKLNTREKGFNRPFAEINTLKLKPLAKFSIFENY